MDGKARQPIFAIEADPVGCGFRIAVEWPNGRVAHVTGLGTEEQARRWVENEAPNWISKPDRLTVDRLNPVTRFLVHHSKFMTMAQQFRSNETGAAMVEYTVLLGIITVAVIATVLLVGGWVRGQWTTLQAALP